MKKAPIDASLLLVDDDPAIIQILSRILSNCTELRFATSGEDALQLARDATPDLILLDAQLGDMSGLQVCEALKADPALADVPVIFVSSHQESELEVAVLELGAVDFIRKPFNAQQVLARVATQLKLKRLSDDLRSLSRVDGATGLPNDRAFHEMLARECRRSAAAGQPVAVALFDLDFSRAYEEMYGAKAWQASVAAVAACVRRGAARPADWACRMTGDEFALILPDTDAASAVEVAHRVLDAVEALAIDHQGSPISGHLTCSAGVAATDLSQPGDAGAAPDALHQGALAALVQAKQAGKAQVVLGSLASPAEPAAAVR